MPGRRVVRSREQAIGIAVVGGVSSILGLAEALSRPEVGAPRTVASVTIAVAWGAFCILRAARAGAFVTRDGVRILNPLRTHFIPWNRIDSFSLRRWGLAPLMGHVNLKDGTSTHIFGIEAPNALTRPRNQSAQRLIAELNEILNEVRTGTSATPQATEEG
jgi:hypothetical protein